MKPFLYLSLNLSLFFFCPEFSFSQSADSFDCLIKEPKFTGIASQSLCDKYPNFSPEYTLGVSSMGLSYPSASSYINANGTNVITGNVSLEGWFVVDQELVFENAVVRALENSGIRVAAPSNLFWRKSLTLVNTKIFCCKGLWRGIGLDSDRNKLTMSNCHIEDATDAISTDNYVALEINGNVFNRNVYGILITKSNNSPGAKFHAFSGNSFTCTSPLNSNVIPNPQEISVAGIILGNGANFIVSTSAINTFEGIKYGIWQSGIKGSVIRTNAILMHDTRIAGILLQGPSWLTLQGCSFFNCANKSIYFTKKARHVSLTNTYINIDGGVGETLTFENSHDGLWIEGLEELATVKLIDFNATIWIPNLSQVKSKSVRIGTWNDGANIYIGESSDFFISASGGTAVHLLGSIDANSLVTIENSRFWVSSNAFNQLPGRGIAVECGGQPINKLKIKSNQFTSAFFKPFDPNAFNQFNQMIFLQGNLGAMGNGNLIKSNHFNGSIQTALVGLHVSDFEGANICDNNFSGNGSQREKGLQIDGVSKEVYLTGNSFSLGGPSVGSVGITGDISIQSHRGNMWFSNPANPPSAHVIASGPPNQGKFVVNEPQSMCLAPDPGCFFTEFHPMLIEPMGYFSIQSGDQLTCPESENGIGIRFDNSDLDVVLNSNSSSGFNSDREFLLNLTILQKLKKYPHLSDQTLAIYETSNSVNFLGRFHHFLFEYSNGLHHTNGTALEIKSKAADIEMNLAEINSVEDQYLSTGNEMVLVARDSLLDTTFHLLTQLSLLHDGYLNGLHSVSDSLFTVLDSVLPRTDYEATLVFLYQKLISLMYKGEIDQETLDTAIYLAETSPSAVIKVLASNLVTGCTLSESQRLTLDESQRQAVLNRTKVQNIECELTVSPNPATTFIEVTNTCNGDGFVYIYSSNGELIKQQFVSANINIIETAALPTGIYFIKFFTKDGCFLDSKFVKNQE